MQVSRDDEALNEMRHYHRAAENVLMRILNGPEAHSKGQTVSVELANELRADNQSKGETIIRQQKTMSGMKTYLQEKDAMIQNLTAAYHDSQQRESALQRELHDLRETDQHRSTMQSKFEETLRRRRDEQNKLEETLRRQRDEDVVLENELKMSKRPRLSKETEPQ